MPAFLNLDKEPSETGVDHTQDADGFEEVKKKIKRGRRPVVEEVDPKAEALEQLFASENWEEIAALYPNIRYALTGWEGFELTDKEKKILGQSLSTAVRAWAAIDPKYLALVIFAANFGGIILKKEMTYRALLIESKKADAEKVKT